MAQNTDIPYIVDDFASSERQETDSDRPNTSVLKDVTKYIDECMKVHNTLDVVDVSDSNMTIKQQVAVHKQVVVHLRDIKSMIDNKIKELV